MDDNSPLSSNLDTSVELEESRELSAHLQQDGDAALTILGDGIIHHDIASAESIQRATGSSCSQFTVRRASRRNGVVQGRLSC